MTKPAPHVTIPQPTRTLRMPVFGSELPLGVILCAQGYQDIGQQVKTLGIRIAVDSKASERCEWFANLAKFNAASAGMEKLQ